EVTTLQFCGDLCKETRVTLKLEHPALLIPLTTVHQQIGNIYMHAVTETDEHDLHRITHINKEKVILSRCQPGLHVSALHADFNCLNLSCQQATQHDTSRSAHFAS